MIWNHKGYNWQIAIVHELGKGMPQRSFFVVALIMHIICAFLVSLRIPAVEAFETVYIRSDGSIDPPSALISPVGNDTYYLIGNVLASIVIERDDIKIDGQGFTVQGEGKGIGINLNGRRNVTINNIQLNSFEYALRLNSSCGNTISESNITGTLYGIYAIESPDNTFTQSRFVTDHAAGLYLGYSDNCTVICNSFMCSNATAISCWDSEYCQFKSNIVKGGYCALDIVYSGRIQISENTIADNGFYGIRIEDNSYDVLVEHNSIMNSGEGIWMHATVSHTIVYNSIAGNYRGFALHGNPGGGNLVRYNEIANNTVGVYLRGSTFNHFSCNNFVNNQAQVQSEQAFNYWNEDYSCGGNYWSDYNGTDSHCGPNQNETGSDGIGDTGYVIDENSVDCFPLMGVFSDFNITSEHRIQTVCNSTVSGFQFNGTAVCFNISGKDGEVGFCRICVPTVLVNGTYRVLINGSEVPYALLPCSNSSHGYLYFTYSLSTQEVVIIPEYSLTSILLLMILVMAVIVFARRKLD
jgi:nitrous oxidase accessory protein NosD